MLNKRDLELVERCTKLLWLSRKGAGEAAPPSAQDLWRLERGQAVGLRAREEFPAGVLVGGRLEDREHLFELTRQAMAGAAPALFEAGFAIANLVARPDVLLRDPGGWVLIEVKATSTSAGPPEDEKKLAEYDLDLATQLHVLEEAGVSVERCELMLLNKDHRHPDVGPLFLRFDRSEAARDSLGRVRAALTRATEVLRREEAPDIALGPQCREGGEDCPFLDRCRGEVGLDGPNTVFDLYSGGKAIWQAIDQGIQRLVDLPDPGLRPLQLRQKQVLASGTPFIDGDALMAQLATWTYPLLHLDFETANFALPRHHGAGPWQQIPFQFSLHVEEGPSAEPLHFEYLHENQSDPRPALGAYLVELLRRWPVSPIVAWYASFERQRLLELADHHPDLAADLRAAASRLVDPRPIVIEAVYLAEFGGSFSLKAVAPALLGEKASYAGLEVGDGSSAIRAWAELITSDNADERARLKAALLTYCKQDTRVMLDVVRKLREFMVAR